MCFLMIEGTKLGMSKFSLRACLAADVTNALAHPVCLARWVGSLCIVKRKPTELHVREPLERTSPYPDVCLSGVWHWQAASWREEK